MAASPATREALAVDLLADRPRTLRLAHPLAVRVVHREVRLATRVAAVEAEAVVRDRYSPELTEGVDGKVFHLALFLFVRLQI